MDDVKRLISCLLQTEFSIDTVESLTSQLKISRAALLQLIEYERCTNYFQLLHPARNRPQTPDKIALTLDLFCCTHYAQQCRNNDCTFLHMCPYHVRPASTHCTNKSCLNEHDVMKSGHNRSIIDARDLLFLSGATLTEIIRASANPTRSFWVCNEYGKKTSCPRRSQCDRLHYCYFALIDACTKSHCSHEISESCLAYFRQKEISDYNHEDILQAFRKVLLQRKSDHITRRNVPQHSSSPSVRQRTPTHENKQTKVKADQVRRRSTSSRRSTPGATGASAASVDDPSSLKSDPPTPVPEHDQDILLLEASDNDENQVVEKHLSNEIGSPIRLIASKRVRCNKKEFLSASQSARPIYYYCSAAKSTDIFQILRWQNEDKHLVAPLVLFSSARDAHNSGAASRGSAQPVARLELRDPSLMCFDRMWIYIFNT